MPTFKDSNGKEWTVKLDAVLIKDLRSSLDFDILADDAFARLATDDVLLVDVLWVLCRAQGTTDVAFGQALATGEAIESACDALIEARRQFFRPGKRSLLRSLEEQQAAVLKEGMAKAEAKVTALRPQILAKLDSDLESLIGRLIATNSPDSSGSAPPA